MPQAQHAQGFGGQPYGAQPQVASPYGAQPQVASQYGAQPQPASAYGAQPQASSPYGAQPQSAWPSAAQPQSSYGAQPQAAQPYGGTGYGNAAFGAPAWGGSQHAAGNAYGGWGQGGQAPAAVDDPECAACDASPAARAKFIERTYLHLAMAIVAFVVLETIAVNLPGIETLVATMIQSRASWGVVLALFCGVSWVADKWASGTASKGMQYAGLGLYTLAEVVIFVPMIYIVRMYVGTEPIIMAGAATMAIFAALTAYVFITKKDFSFMKGTLTTLTVAAVGLVVGSLVFGFSLGLVFSVAMIVLGSGYILFYTSNILKHYRTDQHVAAALALFSAIALVFWYVLRIVLRMAQR